MMENIALNAKVVCKDGVCGTITSIILHPNTQEVTHIVVRDRKIPHKEWLVPIAQVKEASSKGIYLDCTRKELISNKPFITLTWVEKEDLQDPIPLPRGRMVPNRDGNVYVQKMREQLPPGEVAIHQGAKVISFSNKMKYGKATAFQIDPKSHRVANLICQNGFPWRRKQISIPASQIKFIGDHTIYLKWNEQKIPVGS